MKISNMFKSAVAAVSVLALTGVGQVPAFAADNSSYVVSSAYLKSSPHTGGYNIIELVRTGTHLQVLTGGNSWWAHVRTPDGKVGYITTSSRYVHLGQSSTSTASAAATTSSSTGTITSTSTVSPTLQAKLDKLISVGKTQLGVPWRYGTQVPGYGFDCSNFTSWVYKTALGIHFSSASRTQRYDTSIGTPVKIDPTNKYKNLREGDLLFFANSADAGGGGHVGIYAGNGYILQCGGGRAKVTYENMHGTWFEGSLVYAKRIVNS